MKVSEVPSKTKTEKVGEYGSPQGTECRRSEIRDGGTGVTKEEKDRPSKRDILRIFL